MRELSSYLESDSEFAQALLGSFKENIKEFRENFLMAVKAREEKQYMDAYHKIKATLGYSGNAKLKEQCDQIVDLIKSQGITAVDTRLQNSLCRSCSSSIEELQKQIIQYTTKYENFSV
jgi:HPt (histidine-containing phosphotransfer) domain-containing protein